MIELDSVLLSTCSESVQNGVKHLQSVIERDINYPLVKAPGYFVLSLAGFSNHDLFYNMFEESDESNLGAYIFYERLREFTFMLKYLKRHDLLGSDDNDVSHHIESVFGVMENQQTVNGEIFANQLSHTGPLLCLSIAKPETETTKRAAEFFVNNWSDFRFRPKYPRPRLAAGALALSELDYFKYRTEIESMLDALEEDWGKVDIDEFIDEEGTTSSRTIIPAMAFSLMAFSLNPDGEIALVDDIYTTMKEIQFEDGYWEAPDDIPYTAYVLIALISQGDGPKISQYQVNWEKKIENQRHQVSKPKFVSTYPTTSLQTRRREIYERAESMISSVTKELRISSLFMDMLHDDVIDLIESDEEVDVRILSRREKPTKGERQKMKEAVMNELIRTGEGENVRGDNLLHSRMVIADERELLISSADLTRDQLLDEYNAGIYTRDPSAISNAIEFFDSVWEDAESLDIGN